jgi:hypothetical protein
MLEIGSGHRVTDVIARMEEEAEQREQKVRQLVDAFCRRERLVIAEPPYPQSEHSAR